MKRSELIKNAINQMVIVQDYEGFNYEGWLTIDNDRKKSYLTLPINQMGMRGNIMAWRVSSIKHITFANNGKRLW